MEEERAIKDVATRVAEEKGGGQVSSSRDTTMNENASIMFDGANTCDLMAGLMLITGCPWVESMVRNKIQFVILHELEDVVFCSEGKICLV
ncbi:hypothetical protein MKW92_011324 [Papaver armeniacum]|nr:hypothetical protein MKW92_011324 [Papaver armeniacum]